MERKVTQLSWQRNPYQSYDPTIPSYTMSILRFPKEFCEELCSRVARFWWVGNGKERGMHWKNWSLLTRSKSDGGMGFIEFYQLNLALLAKQAWRAIQQPHSLWVRILRVVYFPNQSFMQAKKKRGGSWI